jgi:hypothetical protein
MLAFCDNKYSFGFYDINSRSHEGGVFDETAVARDMPRSRVARTILGSFLDLQVT